MINIIVAMTRERVIGTNGKVPWRINEEMKLFKLLTEGNTVIMGKATWLSLPEKFRPLPNRFNIVVSTTLDPQEGAKVCRSVNEAVEEAKANKTDDIYCIGGGQLYRAMLPLADTLCVSWVKKQYEGDTSFPEIDTNHWKEVERTDYPDFVFKKYLKV